MKTQTLDPALRAKIFDLYTRYTNMRRPSPAKFTSSYLNIFADTEDEHESIQVLEGLLLCLNAAFIADAKKNVDFIQSVFDLMFHLTLDEMHMQLVLLLDFIENGPEHLLGYIAYPLASIPAMQLIPAHYDEGFTLDHLVAIGKSNMSEVERRYALTWAVKGMWSVAVLITQGFKKNLQKEKRHQHRRQARKKTRKGAKRKALTQTT